MIQYVVGTTLASAYEGLRVRGYTLPLVSQTTRLSRASVVISASIKHVAARREWPFDTDELARQHPQFFESNPVTKRDLDLGALVAAIEFSEFRAKVLSGEFETDEALLKPTLQWMRLIAEGMTGETLTEPFELSGYEVPSLEESRKSGNGSSFCKGILTGVRATLEAKNFSDAMRSCLYVGGDRDVSMTVASLGTQRCGHKVPPELAFVTRTICKSI